MKKRLLILVSVIAILIMGCGNQSSTKIQENVSTIENMGKDNVAIESQSGEVVKNTYDFLDAYVEEARIVYSDVDKNNYECVEVIYPSITLSEETAKLYPALAKSLEEMKQEEEKRSKISYEDLITVYEYSITYDDYIMPFDDITEVAILRNDNKILSWLEYAHIYMGGVHGQYANGGVTFDVETGAKLKISDVVLNEDVLKEIIKKKFKEDYPDLLIGSLDGYSIYDEYGFSWSMDYTGITIYFNPYEMGSYADGIQFVRITFAEIPELFNEKYTVTPQQFVMSAHKWSRVYADVNNDRVEEKILFSRGVNESDQYSCVVEIGDKIFEGSIYSDEFELSIVNNGDNCYLYIFHKFENNYPVVEIVNLDTMQAVSDKAEFLNIGLKYEYNSNNDIATKKYYPFINLDNIKLFSLKSDFNGYEGYKNYYTGDDGKLISDDKTYFTDN